MPETRLPNDRLASLRPLYADFPGLHCGIEAALEGSTGVAFVDDAERPRVARIAIGDFHCVAGDTTAPGAREALLAIPFAEYLAAPESWATFAAETIPQLFPYDRFVFDPTQEWDRSHLAALRESLPAGFLLHRIDASTVEEFRDLNESYVSNFVSLEDYLARGVGFGVTDAATGEIIAGCSSYTISSRCLEFEIETRRDYQRRGLALVTGARMIEHCLQTGLKPCWDAAHAGSALLAEKLGFTGRRRYTAYRIGKPSGPPEEGE